MPDDLNPLCAELLRRDPGARPTAREVLDRLGAAEPGGDGATGPPSSQGGELPFVGREAHRAALAGALADVARGRTVVVFVHGRSGVGKSALVRTFLDGPAAGTGPWSWRAAATSGSRSRTRRSTA